MRATLSCISVLSMLVTATAFAAKDKGDALMPISDPRHFEVLGALGVATLGVGNSYLGVTSSETDRLVQTSGNYWNNFTAQLGVGYVYYRSDALQYSENVQWFPSIEPEVNAYYINENNITGDVLRFNSFNFNDLTFSMPIQSTRLMFDTALTIASKKQLSVYVKGGIGNAWNRIGYSDTDKDTGASDPCPEQRLSLNKATRSNFVWEAGAGLQWAFNNRVGLSLEYLYTDLGSASISPHGGTGTITTPVIVPGHFNLNSQAALLGLHIAL